MNKRHYEHTLPNIRGSLSNTYFHYYGAARFSIFNSQFTTIVGKYSLKSFSARSSCAWVFSTTSFN